LRSCDAIGQRIIAESSENFLDLRGWTKRMSLQRRDLSTVDDISRIPRMIALRTLLPNHAAIHCVRRECNPYESNTRARRTCARTLRHSHVSVEMTKVTSARRIFRRAQRAEQSDASQAARAVPRDHAERNARENRSAVAQACTRADFL
jgi:hypothetical protein